MKKLLLMPLLLVSLTSCLVFDEPDNTDLEEHEELKTKLDSIDTMTIDGELLKSANKAMDAGNYFSADQFFQQLMKKSPNNPRYKLEYAKLTRKMGRCDAAMKVYQEIESKDMAGLNKLDLKEEKALCLLNMGEFQEAGVEFTEIINQDSSRWRSINGAGLIFATKKKFNEANQYLDLAADISRGNPAVLNNQGLVKAIIGNYDDSIMVLKKASTRATPQSEQKRRVDLNLAMVYGIAGKIGAAEVTAKPHLTEPQLYNNMGVYSELAKKPELARTYLNKALTGAPIHYERAWDNLERIEKH